MRKAVFALLAIFVHVTAASAQSGAWADKLPNDAASQKALARTMMVRILINVAVLDGG